MSRETHPFDVVCAVTLFEMHFQLRTDGRDRGLWAWLEDNSEGRQETYWKWVDNGLAASIAGADSTLTDAQVVRIHSHILMNMGHLLNRKVDEAALLEWPEVEKLHQVLGKLLAEHKATEARTTTVSR